MNKMLSKRYGSQGKKVTDLHKGCSADPRVDTFVRGLLLDVDRFASHDGPGIRTAVFLKGCPLGCAWCHSPESQANKPEVLYQNERCTGCWLCLEACEEKALTKGRREGRDVAVLDRNRCTACGECINVCYPNALRMAGEEVVAGELATSVAKDMAFFRSSGGGVTLSGGEPAMQPEFSYNFLLSCKEHGIHTALETTGYARWEVMSALASVTDLLLYDVKIVDPARHRRYTRVSNELVLENLRKLASSGHEIQVRVPCIPGVNDSEEHIGDVARLVSGLGIGKIALMPYNSATGAKYEWLDRPFTLPGNQKTQGQEYMESLAKVCRDEGLEVQVGG